MANIMDPQQQFFQALTALREGNLDRCEEMANIAPHYFGFSEPRRIGLDVGFKF